MYEGLFDEKRRIHRVQVDSGQIEKKGIQQSGEFESNILCLKCDNQRIGRLEQYASLVLYGGSPLDVKPGETPDGVKYLYVAGLDYAKFKLFLLSILWRASISSRPLFHEVALGPYEERIRKRILTEDPGEQLIYPCLIMTYLNQDDFPIDLVVQPSQARVDGGYAYNFLIGGFVYMFFVTSRIVPDWISDVAINPEGEIKIVFSTRQLTGQMLSNMTGVNFK